VTRLRQVIVEEGIENVEQALGRSEERGGTLSSL
jgi:hypothetical protein